MDEVEKGLYDWIDSLKTEHDKIMELANEKCIEIAVLEGRRKVASAAVDEIKDDVLREKFYNKFIRDVSEAIDKASDELIDLRAARKELKTHLSAIESAMKSSSYSKAP
ncbi:hypothetical protein [Paenibacillus durus]|uniref:Uncharacterized protein n=1 Tax=Paenibacillus durus ATCC 35681 TaxID=1333534 RepID=A0A0F7F9G4_PAEDU|nr:hypothetical protein [Paenibacillus durus]AKG34652.1 hypothetical protein VK70_08730 [Paenibacillus durus ATCC 35681]